MKKNTKKYLLYGGVIGLGLLLLLSTNSKAQPKKPKPLPDDGNGIPAGWTAGASARLLHGAMAGAGTNLSVIWSVLEGKTPDQLTAIFNRFNELYNQPDRGWLASDENLFEWFENDLNPEDLRRALSYFPQGLDE